MAVAMCSISEGIPPHAWGCIDGLCQLQPGASYFPTYVGVHERIFSKVMMEYPIFPKLWCGFFHKFGIGMSVIQSKSRSRILENSIITLEKIPDSTISLEKIHRTLQGPNTAILKGVFQFGGESWHNAGNLDEEVAHHETHAEAPSAQDQTRPLGSES